MSPVTFTDLAPDRFDRQATEAARTFREQFLLQVLKQHGTDFPEDLLVAALREAEALAGLTPFPELFLPSLAEEKVGRLQDWWTRQQRIRSQEVSFPA
ncbi:MAG: hypothetical protein J0L84_00310 [Verrucomicrobia bacterium]|nr:hypothetical protein [Verrucomicrobiota bacterium]